MKKPSPIPIYNLQERGRRSFEITKVQEGYFNRSYPGIPPVRVHTAHRDENYIIVYQESGSCSVMVDFKEVCISGSAVFCVLPGQVHYGISFDNAVHWVVAVDTDWISEVFRSVLMEVAIRSLPVSIEGTPAQLLKESLNLLAAFDELSPEEHQEQTLRSMLDVCLSQFVTVCLRDLRSVPQANLRTTLITREFRSLLLMSFRQMKRPAEYAAALHISPAYLNEAVKGTTGYPVSYWIQQEIILEAKRMLFYTNITVKEIAYDLGYADPTYFIRLFRKIAGIAPLQFRHKYHK